MRRCHRCPCLSAPSRQNSHERSSLDPTSALVETSSPTWDIHMFVAQQVACPNTSDKLVTCPVHAFPRTAAQNYKVSQRGSKYHKDQQFLKTTCQSHFPLEEISDFSVQVFAAQRNLKIITKEMITRDFCTLKKTKQNTCDSISQAPERHWWPLVRQQPAKRRLLCRTSVPKSVKREQTHRGHDLLSAARGELVVIGLLLIFL